MTSMYRARSKQVGQPGAFQTINSLWAACVEYFEWVESEDGTLWEAQLVKFKDYSRLEKLPKMRAMSKNGLCIFLNIHPKTWERWKLDEMKRPVCEAAEHIIREQKFAGAAAGQLNPVIISRDLGLYETTKNEHTGKDGGPIKLVGAVINVDRKDLEWVLEQL